jgi:hypothetical protein
MKNLHAENAENAEYAATGEQDRKRNRAEGHVVYCDGTEAIIAANIQKVESATEDYWSVGQLISIQVGNNRVVGMLYKVDTKPGSWNADGENEIHIHVELVGEITEDDWQRTIKFSGGISTYPLSRRRRASHPHQGPRSPSTKTRTPCRSRSAACPRTPTIPALISIDSLITRHFAVVGTTGVGKSTAVTLLSAQDRRVAARCAYPDSRSAQ